MLQCFPLPNTYQPPPNMKLLLTVCLTWALLYTAESLHCHVCKNEMCSNTTSVQCPATRLMCQTITSVRGTGSSATVTVNKQCSSLLSCFTPLGVETEWSVNLGYSREAHAQICCLTDNCNSRTLPTTSNMLLLGCVTRYLCSPGAAILAMLANYPSITCEAPWSVSISAMLVTLALALHKILV
ncbi:ly-6/neurotoxin-like protein 1 isoform X2 [Pleuronectes platessa]|uniref:ly-6/neurotoxin-like protein 1 isoform X2 n=1 Tax=Pleuronectes platessa TaxID=8262 RepID=UPI00232A22B2|nr:ly-6/neurotoxin-like protein 1 isoform X2 [Pleuronectes platessa]